jgi:dihydrofolate reductase
MMMPPVVLVAAVADNGVIGRGNALVWRLKTDLQRFKSLTMGCPVIMGRKTFQSIGRALPGRANIVLTRDPAFVARGVTTVLTFDAALNVARFFAESLNASKICVIGGAEIYRLALPFCDEMLLTQVHAAPEGDAYFPDYESDDFEEAGRDDHSSGDNDEHPFTFVTLKRRIAC